MDKTREAGKQKGCEARSNGLQYRILFNREGYTPHYVEDMTDPLGEKRKLVMFDPHSREAAFIYDLKKEEITWEFQVPGSDIANPHQGFLLKQDIPQLGERGDICCTDKNNNIILIDREQKEITFQKQPAEWSPEWLHCVHPGRNYKSLIVTDYSRKGGYIAKLNIPGLKTVWARSDLQKPSKISTIQGKGLFHNPSFGGDYLTCANTPRGKIVEIRDGDGEIVWQNPKQHTRKQQVGEGTWVGAPHSAFRIGRVEAKGNLTVVGSESGGGIIGVNYTGEPIFGFPQLYLQRTDGSIQYYYNPFLLSEITHVFPTKTCRIGFISWAGLNSSIVGEITSFPTRQEVPFTLAFERKTKNEFVGLEPIASAGWITIQIGIKNNGETPLKYEVRGYMIPSPLLESQPQQGGFTVFSGSLASGEQVVKTSSQPYQFHHVRVKSSKQTKPTTYSVYVTKTKG